MSEDEMSFVSEKYGKLDFFPAPSDAWKDTCKKCLLYHNENECHTTFCLSYQRRDVRDGYFSIHQMPEK